MSNAPARVVFHVSQKELVNGALNNMKNLQHGMPSAKITLIANSNSVQMFTLEHVELAARITALIAEEMEFFLCENSLRALTEIEWERIVPGVGTVPSAVVALVEAQQAGASYIKV